jgi:transglutaminase-like putative cysteine protease
MNFKTTAVLLSIILFLFGTAQAQKKDLRFGKISKKNLKMEVLPIDSSADAAILSKFGTGSFTWVNDQGFQYGLEVHVKIKIFTKEGFDQANIEIPYSKRHESIGSLKAASYNLEGNKIIKEKLRRSDFFTEEYNEAYNIQKFTFPDVREGTIIEYRYRIQSDFIYSLRDWQFQHEIPVLYNQLRITIPEYYTYRHNQKGYIPIALKDEKIRQENFVITVTSAPQAGGKITRDKYNVSSKSTQYIYAAENIPAFKEEPYIASAKNYISHIDFELKSTKDFNQRVEYYTINWDEINKVLTEDGNFGQWMSLHRSAKKETEQIIADCTNENEKLLAIYNWVKRNIKWNEQNRLFAKNSVKNVLKDREGSSAEINLLLIAMLKHAGLNAQAVILSTRDNGFINPAYPSIDNFNYVIAYVKAEEETYFLDATESNIPAGLLPKRCVNGYSRLIGPNPREINISGEKKSTYQHQLNLEISDGKLLGKYTGNRGNLAAAEYRENYVNTAAQDKFITSLSEEYPGISIDNFEVQNLNEINQPLRLSYRLEIEDKAEELGSMIYLNPMLYWGLDDNPFKSETRNYPIDYAYPFENTYMLMLQIPEGYALESVPKSQKIMMEKELGSFLLHVTLSRSP